MSSIPKVHVNKCKYCLKNFYPLRKGVKFCSKVCSYNSQKNTSHPKQGDIFGLVDRNKSREKQKAKALLEAVEQGFYGLSSSKETQKAIIDARNLLNKNGDLWKLQN